MEITVTTERDEAYKLVYNAWVERNPNNKPLTNVQVYGLLNDYANDTEYIISAINRLPDKKSNGYDVDYKFLQLYCNRTVGSNKKKIRRDQVVQIGYEEDKNHNLTAYGQHRKMMDTQWHVPTIEDFDPKNPEHLKIQADYLLRSGQIGEPQYDMMMKGIPIVTGETDLYEKLHLVMNVAEAENGDVPF